MVDSAAEQTPEQSQSQRHRAVLEYFQKRQAEDPSFLKQMLDSADIDTAWEELPAAERGALVLVEQFLYPTDLVERRRTTRAVLLIRQLMYEFELADTLDAIPVLPPESPTT